MTGHESGDETRRESPPAKFRRLPNRVSRACQRCRRNKSRCDSFRPCALCVRSNVSCEPGDADSVAGDAPQVRTRRCEPSRSSPRRGTRAAITGDGEAPVVSSPHRSFPSPGRRQARDAVAGDDYQTASRTTPSNRGQDSGHDLDNGGSESLMGIARRMGRLGNKDIEDCTTFAIPDGGRRAQSPHEGSNVTRLPISRILGCRFPEMSTVRSLLEDYFDTVHWFSLVIYEPKFRRKLESIDDGLASVSDASFLTLLSMVLCMAAWYRSKRLGAPIDEVWSLWSKDLLRAVEARLVYLLDEKSIDAVQTCILLGSHHVYHGRPNLSFSLLGASIKISQAMGLHRHSQQNNNDDTEERKRVWWTIYTWDRFASISYGRPMSINDEDFTAEMPIDFAESPYFVRESVESVLPRVVYSRYQTELSKLYQIASPALRNVFGCFSTRNSKLRYESEYAALASTVTAQLFDWRNRLPTHLALDLDHDIPQGNQPLSRRAHTLQSLSLQLTFDNLLVVLYRPFLGKQVDHLAVTSPLSTHVEGSAAISPELRPLFSTEQHPSARTQGDIDATRMGSDGSEYWLSAAARTARLTGLPRLSELAKDSHLVAFMAINLFHSAIVLVLLAISDPLSDKAQKLKRTITMLLRLQEQLGRESALSRQSSGVLRNLISLLLRREREAMLGGDAGYSQEGEGFDTGHSASRNMGSSSMNIDGGSQLLSQGDSRSGLREESHGQMWPSLEVAQRLNESLAFVQQVLPASGENGMSMGSDWSPVAFSGVQPSLAESSLSWPDPGRQSGQGDGSQFVPLGNHLPRNTAEDLFWLWDFTGDNNQHQL